MTKHIDTRRWLKEIASVSKFEEVLKQCVLSDEEREIIRLHYLKGKSLGCIADELGYSESSIKKKHCKILTRLQNLR